MNIGVLVGGLCHESQSKIIYGILDSAKASSSKVFIFACDFANDEKFNEGEYAIFSLPQIEGMDGIIWLTDTVYDDHAKEFIRNRLQEYRIPCISMNYPIPEMINIGIDNYGAMSKIVEHLIKDHGVKTINYIAGPANSHDALERKEAFWDVAFKYGLYPSEDRIYYGTNHSDSGRSAVRYFKQMGMLEADAYVCSNDQMALGAFSELEANGLEIPKDTLITGFDNVDLVAYHYPRITSVKRDEFKMGQRAFSIICDAVEGRDVPKNLKLTCEPVFAESCKCVSKEKCDEEKARRELIRAQIQNERFSQMISASATRLVGVDTKSAFYEYVREYIKDICPESFFLSLSDESKIISDIITGDGIDKLTMGKAGLQIAFVNGKFLDVEKESEKNLILDDVLNSEDGSFFVLKALHYKDRIFGAAIIKNSRLPLETEFYHMLLMNMGNTLENIRKRDKMQDMIRRLNDMWISDNLTGVYNRAGFFKYSDALVSEARRYNQDLMFLFLDLDCLKEINDKMGHDTGDRYICALADILRKNVKEPDLLMRYGGDEFVILGKGYSIEETKEYIQRIRDDITAYNIANINPFILSASIGYYIVGSSTSAPITAMIEMADQKMYEEKQQKHRNRDIKI